MPILSHLSGNFDISRYFPCFHNFLALDKRDSKLWPSLHQLPKTVYMVQTILVQRENTHQCLPFLVSFKPNKQKQKQFVFILNKKKTHILAIHKNGKSGTLSVGEIAQPLLVVRYNREGGHQKWKKNSIFISLLMAPLNNAKRTRQI